MEKRINIALCVGMIENEFSYSIIDGAMLGAKDINANLFILPIGIINAQYDNVGANYYRYQYNTLCSIIDKKSIDAVVLEYGTVTSFLNEEEKKEFLQQFAGIPVILLAGEHDGYSSVCIDNRTGLREVIEHLIIEKQCSKVGFVSGPKTSQDAIERLEVYKEMVQKHHLPIDDSYIVYGNFSEFSEDAVEELITRHPDVEAIVCANDQMASGCYNTLKKHKIRPGEDIYVTGFDDSATAVFLEPHLTSVKADTKELAYLAVRKCEELVEQKEVHELVPTRMIARESSGSSEDINVTISADDIDKTSSEYAKMLADAVFKKYFNNFYDSKETKQMCLLVEEFFDYYLHLVDEDGNLHLDNKEFLEEYQKLSVTYQGGYIALDTFTDIIYMLYHQINHRINQETERLRLVEAITTMNQELIKNVTKQHFADSEITKLFQVSLTNITRDMLQNSDSEAKKYETVISKLKAIGFKSSYIFSYEEGITHMPEDKWIPREHVYLKAYHNQDKQEFFNGQEKRVSCTRIFKSNIMPKDRAVCMLVMPMFSSTEQFGFIFTESNLDYFRYASQIVCQVGVSVEVLEILKKQTEIKEALERNLARVTEDNKVLDKMSHTDTLTGISNRRGYEVAVKAMLSDENNIGKRAVAIYADMDCLKIVNDEFGHDEGDFALKTIADALSESFRSSDVVARMGGDEFAAFSLANHDNFADKIKKRIQGILQEKNINDKPYYVNMSIGTYEFVITQDADLGKILGYADEALYKEKKNKVKVVYKDR